ncbi:MAG: hypothetical protein OEM02_11690 [Desulfobulbaceae bacterium]|nr:hypothetical protein [Desulfobulbaceae bacterium]
MLIANTYLIHFLRKYLFRDRIIVLSKIYATCMVVLINGKEDKRPLVSQILEPGETWVLNRGDHRTAF